jgi:hypothetical protein
MNTVKKNPYAIRLSLSVGKYDRTLNGEDNNTFSAYRADVRVKALYSFSGQVRYYFFEKGPGFFDQLRPDPLDKRTPRGITACLGEALLCWSQNALQANDYHVANNIGLRFLRPPAHIFFLKLDQGFTDLSLYLSFALVHL